MRSKQLNSQGSVNAAVKSICDIMRRSNLAGAMAYVPELTWILFLRILDERETREAEEAKALSVPFTPSLSSPYRWQDWAAPTEQNKLEDTMARRRPGWKRAELVDAGSGKFFGFVNSDLIPHMKELKDKPHAAPRQKVISEIFSGVERTRIDTERNLLDVLDKVNELSHESVDQTHVFALSQVYEGLLLKMGEKNNDGGQFFTPREVIRVLVRGIDPKVGETVYDPCCGTGGFLAEAYALVRSGLGDDVVGEQMEIMKRRTFYGREKDNVIYPIALANLVLHEIDEPHIWHGNSLTGQETYGGLFSGAPALHDVILMNPPFGGKEGKEAQTRFAYKTGATQVLFLQHVIDSLKPGGRAGIVLDEGVLFRTNETAFVQTKRKLLDECDLWAIISLPPGTFINAGAGVKANLLFFTKGKPTERVWYYDISDIKVTKKKPLTRDRFDDFFRMLPKREESERSWTVSRAELEKRGLDLKAVNPNRKVVEDTRTPEQLLDVIEEQGKLVAEAVARLRRLDSAHGKREGVK